jgi:cytochrome c-type biogenesis protein CcmH/NrfG
MTQRLHDEIALREASRADILKELAAGELTSAQAQDLLAREDEALATARAALATTVPPTPKPARRHPRRRLVVALVSFSLAIAGVLVVSLAPRQAGDQITGGLSLSTKNNITRLLQQAEEDVASGHAALALDAYQRVLTIDPTNTTAMVQSGWLTFSAGASARQSDLVASGISQLRHAIRLHPRSAAAHLYYGIVALSARRQNVGRAQLAQFLRLSPSKGQMAVARPFLRQVGLLVTP